MNKSLIYTIMYDIADDGRNNNIFFLYPEMMNKPIFDLILYSDNYDDVPHMVNIPLDDIKSIINRFENKGDYDIIPSKYSMITLYEMYETVAVSSNDSIIDDLVIDTFKELQNGSIFKKYDKKKYKKMGYDKLIIRTDGGSPMFITEL